MVLSLLADPENITELMRLKGSYERRVLCDLLLRQTFELAGQDLEDSKRFFRLLGFDRQEVRGLRSRNWSRRVEAAGNLGLMQSQLAVEPLTRCLLDKDEAVRLAALRSLGQIGGMKDIDIFLDMVQSGGRWSKLRLLDAILECRPPVLFWQSCRRWST